MKAVELWFYLMILYNISFNTRFGLVFLGWYITELVMIKVASLTRENKAKQYKNMFNILHFCKKEEEEGPFFLFPNNHRRATFQDGSQILFGLK